jgi:hypothetical protein
MKMQNIVKHYDLLTPEERFGLILAAGGRGDEAEQERLTKTGKRITLSMSDHSPYAHAFDDLTLLTFIELLEDAARFFDAWHRFAEEELEDEPAEDGEIAEEELEDEPAEDSDIAEADIEEEPAGDGEGEQPIGQRSFDLALAAGFLFRTKVDGWKLFCERMGVPPFSLWESLPGYNRLQSALVMTEKTAFVAEGMVRWLNRIRPAGKSAATIEGLISAEKLARELEVMFRKSAKWWGA